MEIIIYGINYGLLSFQAPKHYRPIVNNRPKLIGLTLPRLVYCLDFKVEA